MMADEFNLQSLGFNSSIGESLSLDAPQQQTIASPVDPEPEERASGFRDFVLRAGLGKGPSLLGFLSSAFGQGTQEIADRKRAARRQELEDKIFEKQASDILTGKPKAEKRQIFTDAAGFTRDALTGERVAPDVEAPDAGLTGSQREFKGLIKNLSPEEAEKATRIKLGLEPRAIGAAAKTVLIGDVPHIFDPVAKEFVQAKVKGKAVTAETVGEAKGTIAAEEARKKGRVVLSNKVIDKAFSTIGNITSNIRNIDRALGALERGAKTGAIQRFLPNITKASVELGQIQKELGLDIVSAVTFGALSKGELDLALGTALPVGLDETALTEFLTRKKSAQEKLRDYYREQINFLDSGGTVAEFSSQQKGEEALPEGLPEGTTNNGDGTFTMPDGTIVEPE